MTYFYLPPPLSDEVIFEQPLILFQYKITAASLICHPLRRLSNISVSPTAHSSVRRDVSRGQTYSKDDDGGGGGDDDH